MNVESISAINQNRVNIKKSHKLNNKPYSSNVMSNLKLPGYNSSIVCFGGGLINKRPFLSILSNFSGIPSPYDGRSMLSSRIYNQMQKAALLYSSSNYKNYILKFMSEPSVKECLKDINLRVFNRIKSHIDVHPNDNLYDALKAMRPNSMKKVLSDELTVFDNIENLTKPTDAKAEFDALLKETRGIVKGDEEDVFRRKIFIKKVNEIIAKYPSLDKKNASQVLRYAASLPTSSTSEDAFIVKYSRPLKTDLNTSQNDILNKVNDLQTEIASFVPKRHSDEFSKYFIDLRESILLGKNYKNARQNLINHVSLLDKWIDSFDVTQDLNSKIRSIPQIAYASKENDLVQRQIAIVSRLAGDSAMSAEHIVPQSVFKQLMENNPERKSEYVEQRDSLLNLMLVDKTNNSLRQDKAFYDFILAKPDVVNKYLPNYFNTIFKLFTANKISPTYIPDIEKQISYIEELSNGLFQMKMPDNIKNLAAQYQPELAASIG